MEGRPDPLGIVSRRVDFSPPVWTDVHPTRFFLDRHYGSGTTGRRLTLPLAGGSADGKGASGGAVSFDASVVCGSLEAFRESVAGGANC